MRKKTKGLGHINISNVDGRSECITLTYSLRNINNITAAKKIITELDKLHKESATTDVIISDFETDEEKFNLKYKIKACEGESYARDIKSKLDAYVAKKGGQTTLDEDEDAN